MKNTLQKVETYLPVFNGFYETIWQFEDENELYCINQERKDQNKSLIEWEDLEIDYTAYENDIVSSIARVLEERLKPFIQSIKIQQIVSPKQYNFQNDSANIEMLADTEAIKDYIYTHIEQYKEFLKARYTGCDGYMPFYSNCFDEWKQYTKDFSDFTDNGHYLGSILEFIAENEKIQEFDLYYDVKEDIDESYYIENYDKLMPQYD